MEALIFSDLHYQEHPEFPFQEVADGVLKQIEEYINKNKIPYVIHLGDLFNSRMKMPVRLISALSKIFYIVKQEGRTIFLLKGNSLHDGDKEDYNGNLFQSVIKIDTPNVVTFEDYLIFFLPYNSKNLLINQINNWKKKFSDETKSKILMTHFGLEGATINDYEVLNQETLSKKDLIWFDFVFAGHFHKHQEVWKNAWQVGSPYRVSFAEKDDKKGFIHFKDGKIKFIKLNVPEMYVIENPINNLCRTFENSFVKVILDEQYIDLKTFDKEIYKSKLIKNGALGVKFEIKRKEDIREVREVRIKKDDSPNKMLDRYLDFTKDSYKNLDLNKLKRIGELAMKG
jgi:DNA repair exonuclease SbcCD nuclease subunit